MGYDEMEKMENGREKAKEYAISGLLTDGGHHKQWCLERVLEALGYDLEQIRAELQKDDYDWEPGIPP
jgi:hypothetical protein